MFAILKIIYEWKKMVVVVNTLYFVARFSLKNWATFAKIKPCLDLCLRFTQNYFIEQGISIVWRPDYQSHIKMFQQIQLVPTLSIPPNISKVWGDWVETLPCLLFDKTTRLISQFILNSKYSNRTSHLLVYKQLLENVCQNMFWQYRRERLGVWTIICLDEKASRSIKLWRMNRRQVSKYISWKKDLKLCCTIFKAWMNCLDRFLWTV